jgi:hypothetical protein
MQFSSNIHSKLRAIITAKPRSHLACEISGKQLIGFNQNGRPPKQQ